MRLKEISYRMKLRTAFKNASLEELKITKEEVIKEIQRRCNKNGKY